jgi:anaerobic magnesium-protoporphyrin IX monomethyl ester cyclase
MVSRNRTMELAEGFIKYQERTGKKFKWNCNGRLNFCTPDILKTMERAGCVFINYGIEAYDDVALKTMQKALTTKVIKRGIEETLKTNMSPGLNFIWGNIGETKETLQKAVDFLLKYDDHSQLRTIRPVTPYPGSPLYHHAINTGLLDKDNPAEDFYKKHVNSDLVCSNFTDLTDQEMHEALRDANKQLIDNYFKHQLGRFNYQTDKLYMEKDVSFRGYRQGSNTGGVEKITTTDDEQKLKYDRQSQMEKNRSELIQAKHVPEKIIRKPDGFNTTGHGL